MLLKNKFTIGFLLAIIAGVAFGHCSQHGWKPGDDKPMPTITLNGETYRIEHCERMLGTPNEHQCTCRISKLGTPPSPNGVKGVKGSPGEKGTAGLQGAGMTIQLSCSDPSNPSIPPQN